jgi:hypothetical protein
MTTEPEAKPPKKDPRIGAKNGGRVNAIHRKFLVSAYARSDSPKVIEAAWERAFPGRPFPSRQARSRYQPPEVFEGKYCILFEKERAAWLAHLPPFAQKRKRMQELNDMAESLRERASEAADKRSEITTQDERGTTMKIIKPSRIELERELRATLAQMDEEVGRHYNLDLNLKAPIQLVSLGGIPTSEETDELTGSTALPPARDENIVEGEFSALALNREEDKEPEDEESEGEEEPELVFGEAEG